MNVSPKTWHLICVTLYNVDGIEFRVINMFNEGGDDCEFSKNDSWRFKKVVGTRTLSFLGCFLTETEVEFYIWFLLIYSISMLFIFLWTDLQCLIFQLTWLNAHLTKIWPYVDQVSVLTVHCVWCLVLFLLRLLYLVFCLLRDFDLSCRQHRNL